MVTCGLDSAHTSPSIISRLYPIQKRPFENLQVPNLIKEVRPRWEYALSNCFDVESTFIVCLPSRQIEELEFGYCRRAQGNATLECNASVPFSVQMRVSPSGSRGSQGSKRGRSKSPSRNTPAVPTEKSKTQRRREALIERERAAAVNEYIAEVKAAHRKERKSARSPSRRGGRAR